MPSTQRKHRTQLSHVAARCGRGSCPSAQFSSTLHHCWHKQDTRGVAGRAHGTAAAAAWVYGHVRLQADEGDAVAAAGHAPPAGPADHPGWQVQRHLCQRAVWEPAGGGSTAIEQRAGAGCCWNVSKGAATAVVAHMCGACILVCLPARAHKAGRQASSVTSIRQVQPCTACASCAVTHGSSTQPSRNRSSSSCWPDRLPLSAAYLLYRSHSCCRGCSVKRL